MACAVLYAMFYGSMRTCILGVTMVLYDCKINFVSFPIVLCLRRIILENHSHLHSEFCFCRLRALSLH